MGFNATWSMAVGGMVGGGIFSVLGVVISIAGGWAWLSFLLGGGIALCAASSYSLLAEKFGEGGGAFTFLRDVHHEEFAGSISWIIIVGYTLTISVYAFTFGHYLANVFSFPPWFPRVAGVSLIALLVGVNLQGVGSAAIVEIVTVWGKLVVLCGLGVWGLSTWVPDRLLVPGAEHGFGDALVGAATVFMAYEGFQLLAYDYDDVEDAQTVVPRAMVTAVLSVVAVYLVVTFGAMMLVGGQTLIDHKEVALAKAGWQLAGTAGTWVVTIAAMFSTASAINATLFAVARLARLVAEDGELPKFFDHQNSTDVPDRAILLLGLAAATLAALGTLHLLVEAASLGFLMTFSVVNVLAFIEIKRRRWISALGALGGLAAATVLVIRQISSRPVAVIAFGAIVFIATVGRHFILRRRD
jgi:amino acid transporter